MIDTICHEIFNDKDNLCFRKMLIDKVELFNIILEMKESVRGQEKNKLHDIKEVYYKD